MPPDPNPKSIIKVKKPGALSCGKGYRGSGFSPMRFFMPVYRKISIGPGEIFPVDFMTKIIGPKRDEPIHPAGTPPRLPPGAASLPVQIVGMAVKRAMAPMLRAAYSMLRPRILAT